MNRIPFRSGSLDLRRISPTEERKGVQLGFGRETRITDVIHLMFEMSSAARKQRIFAIDFALVSQTTSELLIVGGRLEVAP